jgi:hypothetical protein
MFGLSPSLVAGEARDASRQPVYDGVGIEFNGDMNPSSDAGVRILCNFQGDSTWSNKTL